MIDLDGDFAAPVAAEMAVRDDCEEEARCFDGETGGHDR
jgi:hypothetical protein